MTALNRCPTLPSIPGEVRPCPMAASRLDDLDLSTYAALTLADALAILPSAPQLTLRQQQELASAVHTVARVLGEAPTQLPANRRALTRRLDGVAPIAHGISKPAWSNIRSRLNAVLDLVLPLHLRRRRNLPLEPRWQELQERIADQWMRTRLSRLFHFCSEASINPAEVGEKTLIRFESYLEVVRLKNPASLLRETRRAWNRACKEVVDWPGSLMPARARTEGYVLPWSAFPISLYDDTQRWLNRLGQLDTVPDDDAWEEDGPAKVAGPITLRHREYQIRQFASALVRQGRDANSLRTLIDLVEPRALNLGVEFYRKPPHRKVPPALPGLVAGLQSIARYWVKLPSDQMAKVRSLSKKLRKKAPRKEMTAKNRRLVGQILDDPDKALALLRLPRKLVHLAGDQPLPRQAALHMQLAAAIEILLMAPLRISNLAALDLATQIQLPDRSRPRLAGRIMIGAENVKNGVELDHPLPPESTTILCRYRDEFRGALRPSSSALFPGQLGRPKNPQALGRQISAAVFEHTGLRMHPHLFRHTVISLYLSVVPGDFETARLVLGHTSQATAAKTYAYVDQDKLRKRFWKVIQGLRDGAEA